MIDSQADKCGTRTTAWQRHNEGSNRDRQGGEYQAELLKEVRSLRLEMTELRRNKSNEDEIKRKQIGDLQTQIREGNQNVRQADPRREV